MVDVKDYGNGFLTALVILALRNDLAVSAEDVTDLGGGIGEVLMFVTGIIVMKERAMKWIVLNGCIGL